MIKVCRAPNGSRYRFDPMMNGEIEATTLTEPYASLAEKKGCRLICAAFYHGTEVASDKVDAETYAAFNRAVREAVRRINADKRAYLAYFIDYHKPSDPEIGKLTAERYSREPHRGLRSGADPADEMQRTYDWLRELGHAGRDRLAARARQHGRAGARAYRGGISCDGPARRAFRLLARCGRRAF